MKTKKFLQVGLIICTCVFFSSMVTFVIFELCCPQEPTANHIIEMNSHGKVFYVTLVQYIAFLCLISTGGLGIVVFIVTQELLGKRSDKTQTKSTCAK